MNNIKALALSLLLAMPMVVSAAGMGVYVPLTFGEKESVEYDSVTGTTDFEYKPGAGVGIAFDSNIGKDKLYNYRLGLEYTKSKLDKVDGYSITNATYTKKTFNIVNTFGFGVLRTKTVRLWVGPRLNIQFADMESSENSEFSHSDFGIGVAAAGGINVNLGKVVSLAADLDYHVAGIAGDEEWYAGDVGDSYSGTNKGFTARFYVLFRFGEEFQKQAPVAANQGVVDQSL
jgi:hypothetical protein